MACENASVTIANAIPAPRRLTAPSSSASARPAASVARMAGTSGQFQSDSVMSSP